MAELDAAFTGDTATRFAEYAGTVRGHIRYELVKRNLTNYLVSQPKTVLDVGGGTAIDALWLAQQGSTVTIVEPSAEQITDGKARLASQPEDLKNRITFVHSSFEDFVEQDRTSRTTFDLVLSHGVAMYAQEPHFFIEKLGRFMDDGGTISLLEKGKPGAYARLIGQGDYTAAAELWKTGTFVNGMGKDAHAFTPQFMKDWLRAAGASVIDWMGVRIAHDADYRDTTKVDADELATIIDLEEALGTQKSTRGMGQMLHCIARV